MERVAGMINTIDFSFTSREPYAAMHLDPELLKEDVIDFIYEELVPSRRDVLSLDKETVQGIVEETYEAYMHQKIAIIQHLHRNARDRYGWCRERWLDAFFAFESIVKRAGYAIMLIPMQEKYDGKYDLILKKEERVLKVRLKAMEKFDRADDSIDDSWLWIEVDGIYGEPGWLYGKADFIAFEMKECFRVISREKLVSIIEPVMDRYFVLGRKMDVIKHYLLKLKMPMYRRKGLKDKIVLLPARVLDGVSTKYARIGSRPDREKV